MSTNKKTRQDVLTEAIASAQLIRDMASEMGRQKVTKQVQDRVKNKIQPVLTESEDEDIDLDEILRELEDEDLDAEPSDDLDGGDDFGGETPADDAGLDAPVDGTDAAPADDSLGGEDDKPLADMTASELTDIITNVVTQVMDAQGTGDVANDVPDQTVNPDDTMSSDEDEIDLDELLRELDAQDQPDAPPVNEQEKIIQRLSEELKTYRKANKTLKEALDGAAVHLAKAAYANRLLSKGVMTAKQIKTLAEAMDQAKTVKQVETVYTKHLEHLLENKSANPGKQPAVAALRESMEAKAIGKDKPQPKNQKYIIDDETRLQWQRRAGIIRD